MKFSVAAVLAFAAAALAKPVLLNSNYQIEEDTPFTLKWGNAQGPVTVTLMTGNDPNNLKKVADLASKRPLSGVVKCEAKQMLTSHSRRVGQRVHHHPLEPALRQVRHSDHRFQQRAQLQPPVQLRRHRHPPQQLQLRLVGCDPH